ncbi:MAG: ImmA/IrrE family metallo-endopeptidase [Acidobacteriota bacterium]|nr:ImmA/IrrE family metallo-endopeptidase [Acidobacteriota bacterium]
MRVGTPGFLGERLTEVREARGLAQTALSELTGIKSQSISHYEQGRQSPSPDALAQLCEKLRVPESHFRRAFPEYRSEGIFFPAYKPPDRATRLKAERRFGWFKEIAAYVRAHVELSPLRVPRAAGDPAAAAARCRGILGLADEPLGEVVLLIENMGCLVGRSGADIEAEGSYSQWDGDLPYVMLSEAAPPSRLRFDAAHELGHLVMHRDAALRQAADAETHRRIESEADRFARAFLLPASTFGREVWAPTIDALVALKKVWNCPISEMILRCGEIGVFDKDQTRRALVNYSRRGWKLREPHESDTDAEAPRLVARAIRILIDQGGKHPHSVLTDLALAPHDIEDLTVLPRGYFASRSMPAETMVRLRA